MYSLETRSQAINAYTNGVTTKEICKTFGISHSSLYNWIKLFSVRRDTDRNTKYSYSQIISLQKQLAKLAREHTILHQAYNYLNPNLTQRLEIADSLNGQFPTKQMCRVIGIHHATFYNHDRCRVLVTQYELHDKFLKEQITRIHAESDGRFSANKIFQKLTSLGVHTSLGKVSSLMKTPNLKSNRRNSPMHTNDDAPKSFYCKNKLEQNFNQSAPN
ncbi:MAG: transposase [Clostridiales bacterium]|nr:transposase [Clostridiales bacterium]